MARLHELIWKSPCKYLRKAGLQFDEIRCKNVQICEGRLLLNATSDFYFYMNYEIQCLHFISLSWMDDKLLESILPKLMDGRPTTYHYSKALAENLLQSEGTDLPIAVVRPSIVTASFREPVPVSVTLFAEAISFPYSDKDQNLICLFY